MNDHDLRSSDSSTRVEPDALARLVQTLADQVVEARSAWDRVERQAIPLLERIALALERGAIPSPSTPTSDPEPATVPDRTDGRSVADEVRAAIDEGRWDRAQSILDGLPSPADDPQIKSLGLELARSRDRLIANLTDRMNAARLANDADGALGAHDELIKILQGDDRKEVDRSMVAWLMKLIQRRLRSIPVGTDVATLAAVVADRFGGTPEGASLRAALPTLRRSAGLCPRCSEPYLGVDDACPKCLAASGQTATPAPTLTFVSDDDLDGTVRDASPVDLNNTEIWQLP